jgi:hypothetical protein
MGLMSQGEPLSWEETKKHAEHVRKHGVEQFINIYHQLKDRQDNCLKWGDEVSDRQWQTVGLKKTSVLSNCQLFLFQFRCKPTD